MEKAVVFLKNFIAVNVKKLKLLIFTDNIALDR